MALIQVLRAILSLVMLVESVKLLWPAVTVSTSARLPHALLRVELLPARS